MARVFVLERPRRHIDLTDAEEYGEITFLFGDNDRRSSIMQSNLYIADVIAALKAHSFNEEEDYFCLTGAMLPTCLGCIALALYCQATANLLVFNSPHSTYEPQQVSIGELDMMIGDNDASFDR